MGWISRLKNKIRVKKSKKFLDICKDFNFTKEVNDIAEGCYKGLTNVSLIVNVEDLNITKDITINYRIALTFKVVINDSEPDYPGDCSIDITHAYLQGFELYDKNMNEVHLTHEHDYDLIRQIENQYMDLKY